MFKVSAVICFVSIIVFVVGFVPHQETTAQEQDNTEWDTYTDDKFKFSIDYPPHNIDTDSHIEAGEILSLTLGRDFSTDEEYMGISILVSPLKISLSEAVDNDLEVQNQDGPVRMFEGPMDVSVGDDDKTCSKYAYSKFGKTDIHRVVLCEHDDKMYRFDFNGKSILFYYEEEPYNHMINSIRFFD